MKNKDRELLIKNNEKTSIKFGKDPLKRDLKELFEKGFINIDKNHGVNSHQLVDNLKEVLNIKKAGHSGTLDPNVTGVLLIGLGKATRLMEYMLKSNKEYVCHMFIHKEVTKEEILKVFKKFTGKIKQLPPVISAVKREERIREIYSIKLLDYESKGKDILFRVACQHGTYIRKLCSDIGKELGIGAQMKELRRTKAGPIKEEDEIISLDKLRNLFELYNNSKIKKEKEIFEKELKKYIKPMEFLLKDFKKVYVRDSAVDSICHGGDLAIPGIAKLEENIEIGETIAMFTLKNELIGMGMAFLTSKDIIKKRKGAFIKTNKVFMEINTYPQVWDFNKKEE